MDPIEQERAELVALRQEPLGKRFAYYARKSGPGWLQGAITLGGGSLAGALYLGVVSGYHLMWLQPLAMICGVIMLSAISYVTLSTGTRPFGLVNRNVSPALGWAWLIATLMANIVWCMPQFNLGRAAVQQNLIPAMGDGTGSTVAICATLFSLALLVNYFYGSGGKGIQIFERILKTMVAIVVVSFFLVVVVLTVKGGIQWGAILKGFVPNLKYLFAPAPTYAELVAQSGMSAWWDSEIANQQRDKIITAFATAVGINMTFLLPYSILRKRWSREHRSLAIVDLSIGLIVPFVLATACVLIASASQFHGKTADVLAADGSINPKMAGAYNKVLGKRIAAAPALAELSGEALESKRAEVEASLPEADRQLAAMLANRDNFNLANALAPLAGDFVAQVVFGLGVLGMALSTIIILMLINGFTFCEMFNQPDSKSIHLAGCLVAGIGGFFGPFLWTGDAKAALAIPTSVIGGSLIPIAYFTFFLLMNSKKVLGDNLPTGGKRITWNILMLFATGIASFGSIWVLWGKAHSPDKLLSYFGWGGLVVLGLLFVIGTAGYLHHERDHRSS